MDEACPLLKIRTLLTIGSWGSIQHRYLSGCSCERRQRMSVAPCVGPLGMAALERRPFVASWTLLRVEHLPHSVLAPSASAIQEYCGYLVSLCQESNNRCMRRYTQMWRKPQSVALVAVVGKIHEGGEVAQLSRKSSASKVDLAGNRSDRSVRPWLETVERRLRPSQHGR